MSAVLSPWFSVVLLLLCGSSEGLEIITKEPGENVTLTCKDEKKYSRIVLEWSRDGLLPKEVFVFRDGRPSPPVTHESFRNRMFLSDSQMKDGDLSVVLKNLTMNDSGTYQCKAKDENDPQRDLKLISTVRLSVVPPGDPSPGEQGGLERITEVTNANGGTRKEGPSPGGITGIALAVLAAVVIVVVGLWIYRKKKGSNQSSSGSNNQQELELVRLNSDSNVERKK